MPAVPVTPPVAPIVPPVPLPVPPVEEVAPPLPPVALPPVPPVVETPPVPTAPPVDTPLAPPVAVPPCPLESPPVPTLPPEAEPPVLVAPPVPSVLPVPWEHAETSSARQTLVSDDRSVRRRVEERACTAIVCRAPPKVVNVFRDRDPPGGRAAVATRHDVVESSDAARSRTRPSRRRPRCSGCRCRWSPGAGCCSRSPRRCRARRA